MKQTTWALLLTATLLGGVGCGGGTESTPMVSGRVDDFEDGDAVNLLGYEWEAISSGAETYSSVVIETGGPASSVYQLTVGGMRPYGSSGDQVSGVRTLMARKDAVREPGAMDMTAYDGLEISMKGTGGSYIVQLGTSAVEDFDYYNAYVEVEEFWSTFRLPFADFKQEGFGRARTWTGDNVTHIAVYANLFGPFTLNIDNVRFYSDADDVEEVPDP